MEVEPLGGATILARFNNEKGQVHARLFRHTRMSYKYFWFLGLLDLISDNQNASIPVSSVVREMAVLAWHPVCFYHLSLGI